MKIKKKSDPERLVNNLIASYCKNQKTSVHTTNKTD